MPVLKLIIEYDGTNFSGWQIQKNQKTVQGSVADALKTILRSTHALQGASRTDAGVHALGQVASFETATDIAPDRLRNGISAICRPDIAIVNAMIVPDNFNARFDCEAKHYEYQILNRPAPSPILGKHSWHVPQKIDIDIMKKAAKDLLGTHDFAGFRSSDCGREKTRRTLTEISISKSENHIISITVKGTAFLKYMVRIIAGTLVDIGRQKIPPDTIKRVIETTDRTLAGQTAPARGLTLVEIFYPHGWIRKR